MQRRDERSTDTPLVPPINDFASQSARAFVGIQTMLLHGHFAAGDRVSVGRLSDMFCMSRTPIHTALERLAHLGLLEFRPNGGAFVRAFTIDEVRDAISLRGVLEGTAARLAAERRIDNSKKLQDLRRACERAEHAETSVDSPNDYMSCNDAFHAAILALADSEILQRQLEHATALPFASPSAMVIPTSLMNGAENTLAIAREQHKTIVDAIERREGSRAEHAAREHAQLARDVFEAALTDKGALAWIPGRPSMGDLKL